MWDACRIIYAINYLYTSIISPRQRLYLSVGKFKNFKQLLIFRFEFKPVFPLRVFPSSIWLFSYTLDCKAVATRQIPDMYKPKPNPYLNANPNANPKPSNPTSILSKFPRKNFTLHTV